MGSWLAILLASLAVARCFAKSDSASNAQARKGAAKETAKSDVARAKLGAAKVVQLVNVSADGELSVTSEGRQWLVSLAAPARVVVIAGSYKTGKSALLNRLLGQDAFAVGGGADPTTKGLWAAYADGLIFVDTEGLAAVGTPEATDAKLFATSVLFSSLVIYNTWHLIDARQLEYLDLLTRRASLFALRTALRNVIEANTWVTVPPLLWVMQNVAANFSEIGHPSAWLRGLVEKQSSLHGSPMLVTFSNTSAEALPIPTTVASSLQRLHLAPDSTLTNDYRRSIRELKGVVKAAQPKTVSGVAASGAELAKLLATLVEAANEGLVPVLPSLWLTFQERNRASAQGDCVRAYDDLVESELAKSRDRVLTDDEVEAVHEKGIQVCLPLLAEFDVNASSVLQQRHQRLTSHFNSTQERICGIVRQQSRRSWASKASTLQLPLSVHNLSTWADEQIQGVLSAALKETAGLGCTDMAEALREDLDGSLAALNVQNSKRISQALVEVDKKLQSEVKVLDVLSVSEVSQAREAALASWDHTYKEVAGFADGEHSAPIYRGLAREHAVARINELLIASQSAGEAIVTKECTRAKALLKTAIDAMTVPLPTVDMIRLAEAELSKSRANLKKELDRFAENPSLKSSWEDLNKTAQVALEAKIEDKNRILEAHGAKILTQCYTIDTLEKHLHGLFKSGQGNGGVDAAQKEAKEVAMKIARDEFVKYHPLLLATAYAPYWIAVLVAVLLWFVLRRCQSSGRAAQPDG